MNMEKAAQFLIQFSNVRLLKSVLLFSRMFHAK